MRLELLDGADLEGLPEEDYDLAESFLKMQKHRDLCQNLESEIVTMAAQINAVTYRFVKLLSEFDENEGWHGGGRSRMLDSQYGIRYRIAEWKHDTICFQTQNRKGD